MGEPDSSSEFDDSSVSESGARNSESKKIVARMEWPVRRSGLGAVATRGSAIRALY